MGLQAWGSKPGFLCPTQPLFEGLPGRPIWSFARPVRRSLTSEQLTDRRENVARARGCTSAFGWPPVLRVDGVRSGKAPTLPCTFLRRGTRTGDFTIRFECQQACRAPSGGSVCSGTEGQFIVSNGGGYPGDAKKFASSAEARFPANEYKLKSLILAQNERWRRG